MLVWSLGWEDPLEKSIATHSSILAGKSHGQRSLVGYSPWGGRVRHNWMTELDKNNPECAHEGLQRWPKILDITCKILRSWAYVHFSKDKLSSVYHIILSFHDCWATVSHCPSGKCLSCLSDSSCRHSAVTPTTGGPQIWQLQKRKQKRLISQFAGFRNVGVA